MNHTLKVLDLFSGIGGFSLGLERTGGFETVAFCEKEPFCQKVLKKHWPNVPIYDDVRKLDGTTITADVICGGFPCQDISNAGKRAGIEGERSGLWSEFARLIGEIRPKYAIVENVSALLGRGVGRVLGDLAEIGYDTEWHCIQAADISAPHRRDRVWIVAYPKSKGLERARLSGMVAPYIAGGAIRRRWLSTSDIVRGRNELPDWVDRIKSLGNAVVPQIPEIIGRAILESL